MLICKKCGSQMPDDAKFCNTCGEKLENNDSLSINANESSQTANYVEDVTIQDMILKTTGRLNRLRYFKRTLILGFIFGFIASFIGVFLTVSDICTPNEANFFASFISMTSVPLFYSLNVRRLHDMNYDNKIAIGFAVIQFIAIMQSLIYFISNELFLMIVVINIIAGMFMLVMDGTHGRNDYGADPLNR